MKTDFWERLTERSQQLDTVLCVGLDPRLRRGQEDDPKAALVALTVSLVERTEKWVAAFKPNIAFFEAWGLAGLEALQTILQTIPPDIPVILDAKRGDIGSTAEAYAQAAFQQWKVGAITLAPYMGRDSVDPFLAYEGKGVFVLARTSNPSAVALQDIVVHGRPLYLETARQAAAWSPRVGLVVAGNENRALSLIRKELPDTWFLAPGVGIQGGKADEVVSAGARADGLGILASVSREVADAPDPEKMAEKMRSLLNKNRPRPAKTTGFESAPDSLKGRIIKGLLKVGAFQVGDFVLKSGDHSPFYIDLRRASSDPVLLRDIGKAYASLLEGLTFDSLAALPVAALPLGAATSLETGKPLVYPRIPPKPHGLGRPVEGVWNAGDTVVMLDDLITTGASKEEALMVLQGVGLVVKTLVVLVERGHAGRFDMDRLGIRLRAFMSLEEFLPVLVAEKAITEGQSDLFLAFARGDSANK